MGLARRSIIEVKDFNMSVSYRIGDTDTIMRDARNVYANQGRLETRFGYSRFNPVSLGSAILSQSFFKDTDLNRYLFAKADTTLYSLDELGASSVIKTGLTSTTKHRGLTTNNRHVFAIESDGLFQYDTTNGFTQLGQDPPIAPTITTSSGGSLTDATTYTVKLTYYSTTTGFESNGGAKSNEVTTASPNLQIDISSIPATAANATIDKIRVYLSKDGGSFLFSKEISLGTTTTSITEDSESAQVPPTTHASPQSGGGKYLTLFNGSLAYTGSETFKNDVFISEQNLPDAYDNTETAKTLFADGDGPNTGIATGFFNDGELDPFLVIFKKNTTHIYSEIGGQPRFTKIDDQIGCVSHETITVRNGVVYFLSTKGWRAIRNGLLIKDSKGRVATLAGGDIDDIFTSKGYTYELNTLQLSNAFSAYYPALDQYFTFVAEGSNTAFNKAYIYEFDNNAFKVYGFSLNFKSTCGYEDSSGNDIVMFGDENGFIYTHSILESRTDVDADNNDIDIAAFALMNWMVGDDYDATFSFRELLIRTVASSDDLTVKGFINFDSADIKEYTYEFDGPQSGFVLDVSKLDEGVFSDDRTIVTSRADINRTGESLLIGFYQTGQDKNMNLISYQMHANKNKNRNLS